MRSPPSPELVLWITAEAGPPRGLAPCGWPQGRSRVWRVHRPDGPPLFLKQYSDETTRQQELRTYREWLPAVRDDVTRTPRVVAESPPVLCSLLLDGLDGELVSRIPLEEAEGAWAHRRAGEWIARLHAIPFTDDDPMPLSEAIPLRLAFWLDRGGEELSREEGDLARRLVGDGSIFVGDRRVPCHRDFQMRNWILDRTSDPHRLGVIDFEHARPDHPLVDSVRVRERALPRYPSWFDAFVDGMGIPVDPRIEAKLIALSAVHAVGSVVWGAQQGDRSLRQEGHSLLDRLRAET